MEDLVKAMKGEVFILGANCCLLFNLRMSKVVLFILEHCDQFSLCLFSSRQALKNQPVVL